MTSQPFSHQPFQSSAVPSSSVTPANMDRYVSSSSQAVWGVDSRSSPNTRLQPAHFADDVRRQPGGSNGQAPTTFTLPGRHAEAAYGKRPAPDAPASPSPKRRRVDEPTIPIISGYTMGECGTASGAGLRGSEGANTTSGAQNDWTSWTVPNTGVGHQPWDQRVVGNPVASDGCVLSYGTTNGEIPANYPPPQAKNPQFQLASRSDVNIARWERPVAVAWSLPVRGQRDDPVDLADRAGPSPEASCDTAPGVPPGESNIASIPGVVQTLAL